MENNKETKKKINMVLLFEIIVFIAVLITYNYLTKFTLTENKIIADLVSEFSLSLDIMIVIRTITSILTVIISVLISSLLMIIFFNKLEKKEFETDELRTIVYKSFLVGMIIHYLTLIFSFFMGFKINLNVLSLISYAVVSVILALLFMRNMKFKLGNIIVVSTLFYFINCGAAILELVNII